MLHAPAKLHHEDTPLLRILFLLLIFFSCPAVSQAQWTAELSPCAPALLFAADKARNLLFQVENPSGNLEISRQFPCIHGRIEGDKQKRGDLRTPEGIYFITRKITQPLDFMEYGPHAFNLNYPNPADRLKGKTGGGIWLHSKGQPINGIRTRGCLAIEQQDIISLLPLLSPGTALVIAENLRGIPFESEPDVSSEQQYSLSAGQTASALKPDGQKILEQTLSWLDCREQCSEKIFDLYDRKNYPLGSREKFSALQKRMKADFRKQEDLILDKDSVRILAGPDYYVSLFSKTYRHKGTLNQGIQALYWMPDAGGTFRIIGEVWLPSAL